MRKSVQPPQRQPSALELASQWIQFPPEYLSAAIEALEPQLRREHELRKKELDQVTLRERHSFTLRIMEVMAGFAIALTSLVAAIALGKRDLTLAGILLTGPGLTNVITTFVFRWPGRAQTRREQPSPESAESAAEQVITPYQVTGLLDKLDVLTSQPGPR